MKIATSKTETLTLSIMHLEGAIDGSNYKNLIEEAHKLYASGIRNLIMDLSKLTFISSAGLGALHQVALEFRGKEHAEKEENWSSYRWSAFRTTGGEQQHSLETHVKLFSPSKEVMEVLDMIGFTSVFEIFTDLNQAISSFQ